MTYFQKNFSRVEKQGLLRLRNVGSSSTSAARFYGKATKLHCLKILKKCGHYHWQFCNIETCAVNF